MGTILFLLDQAVKEYAEGRMRLGEEHEVLPGKVVARKVYNKGFLLNHYEDSPRLVQRASIVVATFVLVYYWFCLRGNSWLKKLGMAMLVGGALSNTYDRLIRGYVIDYVGLVTKNERISRITFNLADVFIAMGCLVVAIGSLLHKN